MNLPHENPTRQARNTESDIFRSDMPISERAKPDLLLSDFFVWQMLWVLQPRGLDNYAYLP